MTCESLNALPPYQIPDLFPLAARENRFAAIDWPLNTCVSQFQVERKSIPSAPSSLQQADVLFAEEKYESALELYTEVSHTTEVELLQQECDYKRAVCMSSIGQSAKAFAIWESLFDSSGDRWPMLAGCQLWAGKLKSRNLEEANIIFEVLSTRFRFDQVIQLIPEELRVSILEGNTKRMQSFIEMAEFDPNLIRDMQRNAEVDRLLSLDGRGDPYRQLQVSRAYRLMADMKGALRETTRLHAMFPKYNTIAIHHSRMLRLTGQVEKAEAMLDDFCRRLTNEEYGVNGERIRVYVAGGKLEIAEQLCDETID